jgi:ribonuclease Z
MDQTEVPVLAFLGDTTPEALSHPEVQRAQTLITECTFVGGDVTDTYAREMGHTHLKELVPYLSGMAFKSLLLMHFSLRYSRKEVEATVTETLPEQVKERTSVLFDDDSSVQKR